MSNAAAAAKSSSRIHMKGYKMTIDQSKLDRLTSLIPQLADGPWVLDEPLEYFDEDKSFFIENCPFGCPDDECEGHIEEDRRRYWVNGPRWCNDEEYGNWFDEPTARFLILCRELLPQLLAEHAVYRANTNNLRGAIRDVVAAMDEND